MYKTLYYARGVVNLCSLLKNKSYCRKIHTSCIKNSGVPARWSYRTDDPPPPIRIERIANALGAFMWYWIIYHCLTQYEHLIGEFDYPEPEKWTDEELGIPPDDEN